MKINFIILILFTLLTLGCKLDPIRTGTEQLNLPTPRITELKRSSDFHQKTIELTGYYFSGFELSGLFESKNSGQEEAVWVDFSDELNKHIDSAMEERLQGRKLRVQGIFNATSRGHLGIYIGTVELDFLETVN
ncbi:MAG: hypothetical protein ABJF04_11855 [Reichenbachiella sp.]|uniref:hypothetical protein n=1 Tax=Reichenbachiella sp. TaxID=2184521 RepID=UPI003264DAF1